MSGHRTVTDVHRRLMLCWTGISSATRQALTPPWQSNSGKGKGLRVWLILKAVISTFLFQVRSQQQKRKREGKRHLDRDSQRQLLETENTTGEVIYLGTWATLPTDLRVLPCACPHHPTENPPVLIKPLRQGRPCQPASPRGPGLQLAGKLPARVWSALQM